MDHLDRAHCTPATQPIAAASRARRRIAWLLLPCAAACFAGGIPSSTEREAQVLVVTKWDDDNGRCDASDRSAWDNMLDAWYDEMSDNSHGSRAWDSDSFRKNDGVTEDDFADADAVSWGNDTGGGDLDEGDAVMIGMHGGEYSNTNDWYGVPYEDCSGTDCDCDVGQGYLRLGDSDLEFFHMSSCNSLDDEDWDEWTATAFDGLHEIDGFAGIMYISTTYNGRYRGFADDGFDIELSSAWLDQQYSNGFWTGGDHCPVAIGAGLSVSDAESRIGTNEYDDVASDPDNPSDFVVIWLGGCDPSNENALATCGTIECDDINP